MPKQRSKAASSAASAAALAKAGFSSSGFIGFSSFANDSDSGSKPVDRKTSNEVTTSEKQLKKGNTLTASDVYAYLVFLFVENYLLV